MATSYIKYKGSGFWENDRLLELVGNIMLLKIRRESNFSEEPWLQDLISRLDNIRKGYFTGFINFDFDNIAADIDKKERLISILQSCIHYIKGQGDILTIEYLNRFNQDVKNYPHWKVHLESFQIINTLESMVKILSSQ